jgi:hypothetical protein
MPEYNIFRSMLAFSNKKTLPKKNRKGCVQLLMISPFLSWKWYSRYV